MASPAHHKRSLIAAPSHFPVQIMGSPLLRSSTPTTLTPSCAVVCALLALSCQPRSHFFAYSSPTIGFWSRASRWPSQPTYTIKALSTPSGAVAPLVNALQARVHPDLVANPNDLTQQALIDMMYPSLPFSSALSILLFLIFLSRRTRVSKSSLAALSKAFNGYFSYSAPVVVRAVLQT